MNKLQFYVLHRQFLFRVVDAELLSESAKGDASKLMGQFAALLIFFSTVVGLTGLLADQRNMRPAAILAMDWTVEHFLIQTTMLVVGLLGVLSWDTTFLDLRDVLVLGPLPVRRSTLFLAKVAAVATALGAAVVALHVFAGLTWPPVFMPAHSGVFGLARSFAAYWITMVGAGVFVLCLMLGVQGLAALLPRPQFLRVSGLIQTTAFCLVLSGYFLEPTVVRPQDFTAPGNQQLLSWPPSYWFLGLFNFLNGTAQPALASMARRAIVGLLIGVLGAGAAFLFSYVRTLHKIVEEPDITPGVRGGRWLPRFGDPPLTAIVQFSIRTLFRSRQHRLILSFFLGLAFTIVILYVKTPLAQRSLLDASGTNPWHQVNVPLLVSSIVMMWFAVIGTRVAFAMPTELRANWIFRMTDFRRLPDYVKATRRSLFALTVAPVWMIWAGVLLWLWPWRLAPGHLIVLGLLGTILVEACLYGFHKIPFTCSYLPGKANVYYLFLAYGTLTVYLLDRAARLEQSALQSTPRYTAVLLVMSALAILVRWRTMVLSRSEGAELRFEEEEPPAVLELGLHRDGAPMIGPIAAGAREETSKYRNWSF
jgi:hypothetical protein